MYLLAILFPPLAVLLCNKPFQAFINLLLTLFFYIPGLIHALLVVSNHKQKEHFAALAGAVRDRY